MAVLAFVLALIIGVGLSWGATVGIVYLITLCFGLTWSLKIATGIWLMLSLLATYTTRTIKFEK